MECFLVRAEVLQIVVPYFSFSCFAPGSCVCILKMRLFTSIFCSLTVAVFLCNAQTSTGSNGAPQRTIDISKIPSCGLICMAKTAPQSGCSLTDVDCVCKSQKMIDSTTKCALQECSTADASSTSSQTIPIFSTLWV